MVFNIFKKRVMPTTPVWDNDLRKCPSQCYCYFETLGNKYCIYLCWRWDDPWSARVVPCNENWEFNYNGYWRELDVPFTTHDDYKRLQKYCVKKVLDIFDNIKWRESELNVVGNNTIKKIDNINWLPIDRDENGRIIDDCYYAMLDSLDEHPCFVVSADLNYCDYLIVTRLTSIEEWYDLVMPNPHYTHYLPIPKLEV